MGDILAIISEIDSNNVLPMMQCCHSENAIPVDISETKNKYYLSINTKNSMGVIARLGKACEDNNVSLASIVQKEGTAAPEDCRNTETSDKCVEITVITEVCLEKDMQKVVEVLNNDSAINAVNSLIRVQF